MLWMIMLICQITDHIYMKCSNCGKDGHSKRSCSVNKESDVGFSPSVLIKVMQKGDEILSVNNNIIIVKRTSGDVDMIPLIIDEDKLIRIDNKNIFRITYGNNEVKIINKSGADKEKGGEVTVETY